MSVSGLEYLLCLYDQRLLKICNEAGVNVHDFTRLVPDDDFADSVHLTPSGIEKFQAAVMPICVSIICDQPAYCRRRTNQESLELALGTPRRSSTKALPTHWKRSWN